MRGNARDRRAIDHETRHLLRQLKRPPGAARSLVVSERMENVSRGRVRPLRLVGKLSEDAAGAGVPEGWSLWWVIRATVAQVRDSYRRHRDSQRTPPVLVIVPRSPVGRAAKGPADSGRAA